MSKGGQLGLIKKITSKETWRQVKYWSTMMGEDPKRKITKDDILPLILTFMIAIIALVLVYTIFSEVSDFVKHHRK